MLNVLGQQYHIDFQKIKNNMLESMHGEAMDSRPSYRWENSQYLLKTIMNQLAITEEDLENDPSWIKAKVRESNIDKVLENN